MNASQIAMSGGAPALDLYENEAAKSFRQWSDCPGLCACQEQDQGKVGWGRKELEKKEVRKSLKLFGYSVTCVMTGAEGSFGFGS